MLAKTIATIVQSGLEKNKDAEDIITQVLKAALPPVLQLTVTFDDKGTYVAMEVNTEDVEPWHVMKAIKVLKNFGELKAKEEAGEDAKFDPEASDNTDPFDLVIKTISKKIRQAGNEVDESSPAFKTLLETLVSVGEADLKKIKADGGKAEDGPSEDAKALIQAAFQQYIADVKAAAK